MTISSNFIIDKFGVPPTPVYESMMVTDLKEILTETQYTIVTSKISGKRSVEIARDLSVSPTTITKRMVEIKKIIKDYLYERIQS